ncbi:MAG: hypothetical protein QW680_07030 [Pyrobaculum sp.]
MLRQSATTAIKNWPLHGARQHRGGRTNAPHCKYTGIAESAGIAGVEIRRELKTLRAALVSEPPPRQT